MRETIAFVRHGSGKLTQESWVGATQNYVLVFDVHQETFVYVGSCDGVLERWTIHAGEFKLDFRTSFPEGPISGAYDPKRRSVVIIAPRHESSGFFLYECSSFSITEIETEPLVSEDYVELSYNEASRRLVAITRNYVWELSRSNTWLRLTTHDLEHSIGRIQIAWDAVNEKLMFLGQGPSSFSTFYWDGREISDPKVHHQRDLSQMSLDATIMLATHPTHGLVIVNRNLHWGEHWQHSLQPELPLMKGGRVAYDPWLKEYIIGPTKQGFGQALRNFYLYRDGSWTVCGDDSYHPLRHLSVGELRPPMFFEVNNHSYVSDTGLRTFMFNEHWEEVCEGVSELSVRAIVGMGDHALAITESGSVWRFDGASWGSTSTAVPNFGMNRAHLVRLGNTDDLLLCVEGDEESSSTTFVRQQGEWRKVVAREAVGPFTLLWDTKLKRVLRLGTEAHSWTGTNWNRHSPANYNTLSDSDDRHFLHDERTGETFIVHWKKRRISRFDIQRCSSVSRLGIPSGIDEDSLRTLRFHKGALRIDDLRSPDTQYEWSLWPLLSRLKEQHAKSVESAPPRPSLAPAPVAKSLPSRRSRTRQAPGKKLASGTIRVDATRALAKLRDYQLTDTELWICEVVRAAILKGGTNIRAVADADDVWVTWQDAFFDEEDMPDLLNELVSPIGGRFAERLLAVGINTALGGDAKFVHVISKRNGVIHNTSFTTKVYDGERPTESTTSKPLPESLATVDGMCVHRRRSALSGIKNWIGRKAAPELQSLRKAGGNHTAPIWVDGVDITKNYQERDLIRLPLRSGQMGFLAITDFTMSTNMNVEIAEAGITLQHSSRPWGVESVAPPPIRLYLNAKRLPVNASRSEVRENEEPIVSGYDVADQQIPELIEMLASQYQSEKDDHRKVDLRLAAIRLLACHFSVTEWIERMDLVPEVLQPLVELPLFQNPFGDWMSLREFDHNVVYDGDAPLESKYRDLFANTLWLDAQTQALFSTANVQKLSDPSTGHRRRTIFEALVARQQAKIKYLEHQRFVSPVPTYEIGDVPANSCISKGLVTAYGKLSGALTLHPLPPRVNAQNYATINVLYEGRVLCREQIECSVPVTAWITHADLEPNETFSGLDDDEMLGVICRHVYVATLVALERLALLFDQETADDEMLGVICRHVHVATLVAPEQLALQFDPETDMDGVKETHLEKTTQYLTAAVLLTQRGLLMADRTLTMLKQFGHELELPEDNPLLRAAVWPCKEEADGTHVAFAHPMSSVQGLRRTPLVLVVDDVSAWTPPNSQAIEASTEMLAALKSQLGNTMLIPYKQRESVQVQRLRTNTVGVMVEEKERRGSISFASRSKLVLHHRGAALQRSPFVPTYFDSVQIYADDDRIIPDGKGGVARTGTRFWESWELRLIKSSIRSLANNEDPDAYGELTRLQMDSVLLAAAKAQLTDLLSEDELAKFRSMSLFELAGGGQTSLAELSALPGASIPYLGFQISEPFHALYAREEIAKAICRLANKKAHPGDKDLRRLQTQNQRSLALRRHIEQQPAKFAAESRPSIYTELGVEAHWHARLTLADTAGYLMIRVLVESRSFTGMEIESPLPLVVTVDVPEEFVGPHFQVVPDERVVEIHAGIQQAVPRLLMHILATAPRTLMMPGPAYKLLSEYLKNASLSVEHTDLIDAIQSAKIFTAITGEEISIQDASTEKTTWMAKSPGKWLAALEGETELRTTIKAEPLDDFEGVLRKLAHPRRVTDNTKGVLQLHTARKLDRGEFDMPTVDSSAHFSRELRGWVPKKIRTSFPFGEVGFREISPSEVSFYADGESTGKVVVDVSPPITVAVESSDMLSRVAFVVGTPLFEKGAKQYVQRRTQALADHLTEELLTSADVSIPRPLRFAIRDAFISKKSKIRKTLFNHLPCFSTSEESLVSIMDIKSAQSGGELWCVEEATPPFQAPPDRVILKCNMQSPDWKRVKKFLTEETGCNPIDATQHVENAFVRQRNLAAPKNHLLTLPSPQSIALRTKFTAADGSLGHMQCEVGILHPGFESKRSVLPHIDNIPLQAMSDECAWPTVAIFNAKLVADDRFEQPKNDAKTRRVLKKIRTLSEELVTQFLAPPPQAHFSMRIQDFTTSKVKGGAWSGVIWVADDTLFRKGVQMFTSEEPYDCDWLRSLSGRIYAHESGAFRSEKFAERMKKAHKNLVVQMARNVTSNTFDAARAQCAVALFNNVITPRMLPKNIDFPSLEMSPTKLAKLFEGDELVRLVESKAEGTGSGATLMVDDSLEFRTLERLLRRQLYRDSSKIFHAVKAAKKLSQPKPIKKVEEKKKLLPALVYELGKLLPQNMKSQLEVDEHQKVLVRYEAKTLSTTFRIILGGANPQLESLDAQLQSDRSSGSESLAILGMHILHLDGIERGESTQGFESAFMTEVLRRMSDA